MLMRPKGFFMPANLKGNLKSSCFTFSEVCFSLVANKSLKLKVKVDTASHAE